MKQFICMVSALAALGCVRVQTHAEHTTPAASATIPTVDISTASEDIVARTNAERRSNALPPLRRVTKLMQAAQLHADQMAARQQMSHDLAGAKYPLPADRLAAVQYEWSTSGENVAEGYPDAAGVVAGWMKSPGHRANILSKSFTEIGAGVATGKNGRRYFVQVFATPR